MLDQLDGGLVLMMQLAKGRPDGLKIIIAMCLCRPSDMIHSNCSTLIVMVINASLSCVAPCNVHQSKTAGVRNCVACTSEDEINKIIHVMSATVYTWTIHATVTKNGFSPSLASTVPIFRRSSPTANRSFSAVAGLSKTKGSCTPLS